MNQMEQWVLKDEGPMNSEIGTSYYVQMNHMEQWALRDEGPNELRDRDILLCVLIVKIVESGKYVT